MSGRGAAIARAAARRAGAALVIAFLVSILVFSLVLFVPGDPAIAVAGDSADPAYIAAVREELGLNDPILTQYGRWLGNALRGDLGESLVTGESVVHGLWIRLPATFSLMLVAVGFALLIGIPAGVLAGLRPGSAIDKLVSSGASLGLAVPNFWLGLMLIILFAIRLDWLPAIGYASITEGPWQWLRHLLLPGFTLGTAGAAEIARQTRAGVADVHRREFVRTAYAYGLPRRRVVGRHVMRSASIPIVTVLGLQVANLLGGSVIVESVFGIDGIGKYAVGAVIQRDFPVVQGMVVMVTIVVLVVNLAVDFSYTVLNPRVRLT